MYCYDSISIDLLFSIIDFCLFQFKRNFVRLGEHDTSTDKDGKHQDIDIVGARKHEQYVKNTGIHDIAMVYLKKDVTFNGK